MRFEDVVAVVGVDRYRLACEWAWRTALDGDDQRRPWPDDLDDVPHDLCDPLWFQGQTAMATRLTLGVRLLWEMPCYSNTMYMTGFYGEWTADQREFFWGALSAMFDSDDERQSAPVAYALWVDLFGHDQRGNDAWAAFLGLGAATPARRLDRVLPLTGPVPWRVKAPLLESLAAQETRHPAIFRALLAAEFDYFGANDRPAARQILSKLTVPPETEQFEQLHTRLHSQD